MEKEKELIKFSEKQLKEIQEVSDLVRTTINKFEEEKFPKYISNYKQYLWYVLDRLADIESWQTNISYPHAASIVDTEFANLFDFDYVFWIQEEELRKICNKTFDFNSQWKVAIKDALKECLICWEWFIWTWLIKKSEKYSILNNTKTITVETKKPSMEYVSIFNVFYDLTYWISKSPYQITRVFNTWKYIHERYSVFFKRKDKEEVSNDDVKNFIDSILHSTERKMKRFSNYDYNPVKSINNYSNIIVKSHNNKAPINTSVRVVTNEIGNIDENNFYLVKNAKSYEIVEANYNDKVYIFIDWTLLYYWDPLIEWDLSAIRWISFNDIPWSWTSNWQIDNLSHLQHIITGIWNAFLDNIKMQMSWMFAVYGNVPWLSKEWKLRFEKFKWLKMSPDSKIERIDLWLNDFTPLNVWQYIEQMTEKRAWVNWYLLWWQSKVERVSDSINLIHDQYKSKLTPIIDSIQIMMGRVSKTWVLMYLKYFTEKELNKMWLIFGVDEDKKITVNNILVEDIINDENISFQFNSLRNIEKEKKRWIIKEIFVQLIQMKQMNPEQINELFNILLDDNFDLVKFKWFWKNNKWIIPQEIIKNTEQDFSKQWRQQFNPWWEQWVEQWEEQWWEFKWQQEDPLELLKKLWI